MDETRAIGYPARFALPPHVIPNGAGRLFLPAWLLRGGRPADVRNLSSLCLVRGALPSVFAHPSGTAFRLCGFDFIVPAFVFRRAAGLFILSQVDRRFRPCRKGPRPQSFSYGRFQRRALASIFPGSYSHLSPEDTAERAFRSVSNG